MSERLGINEDRAWRDLIRIATILPRVLDTQLRRSTPLSLSEFGVLLHLSEATDGELRMGDIAASTGLSPSRITRVVAEMRVHELVEGRQDRDDARSQIARITDLGRQQQAQAYQVQVAGARELIFDHVDDDDVARLAELLDGVVRRLRTAGGTVAIPAGQPGWE